MSSVYSTRRNSLREVILHETSKSVPQTPAKPEHRPVFRTVPESPKHCRLLSDDHGLDIEILTHKLQLYQLELEEADLRFRQRRMEKQKEAADVAAAKKFREELEKQAQTTRADPEAVTFKRPPRTSSLRVSKHVKVPSTSLLLAPPTTIVRSRRPTALDLLAASDAEPQEIRSAALPVKRDRSSNMAADEAKKHWRRTTISAGRDTNSKIFLMSSPGKLTEYDFPANLPPVPQLAVSNSTSPLTMSPVTPLAAEDRIRRELETFALEEGPDLRMSRRSSVASRRRMPAAFVPAPEDRVLPQPPTEGSPLSAFTVLPDDDADETSHVKPHTLTRKKSFFDRFERKNQVDSLLDLYMTEDQLIEEKLQRKATKSRRQTFFRTFSRKDDKPG